jgi:hypothetical protein
MNMNTANRWPTMKKMFMMSSVMRIGEALPELPEPEPSVEFACGVLFTGEAEIDLEWISGPGVEVALPVVARSALDAAVVVEGTLTPGGALPEMIGWCCLISWPG